MIKFEKVAKTYKNGTHALYDISLDINDGEFVYIIGGLGSAVSEVVVSNKPVPMEFVGVQDTFGESGTPKELMAKYGLTANDIVEAVKRVIARK